MIFKFLTGNPYVLGAAIAIAFTAGGLAAWTTRGWMADAAQLAAVNKAVKRLGEQLDAKDAEIARRDALAASYEGRKAIRVEERVKYVEKPVYRDCEPDLDWVQQYRSRLTEGNASIRPGKP